jgi:hypothetical protein
LIILKAILIILALILLFCAGVACYAIALMKKRPPLALYERRTRQPDFIPLSRIPKRQVDLLVKLEDSNFYTHRGYDVEDIRDALGRFSCAVTREGEEYVIRLQAVPHIGQQAEGEAVHGG